MKPLVVVDSPKRWPLEIPGAELVSSYQYLTDPSFALGPGRKVFNLCRSYRYQAAGYYVSLLAEARGHRPLPSVAAIQDLKLTPLVRIVSQDLEELIQTGLSRIKTSPFELSVYFGHNLAGGHDRLATALFNAFPVPLMRARFERKRQNWEMTSIRVIAVGEVPDSHRPFLIEQAKRYLRRVPRQSRNDSVPRFELAILHDPHEKLAPSNPKALKKFITAGESMGIGCELIEKDAYGRVAEFDGLFIRQTTAVNHHTYRFARRAAAAGLVVIDDPTSILRCTNKVFLAETLSRSRIPTPRTLILSKENALDGIRELGFPCVVKSPDSAFSAGVRRLDSDEDLEAQLRENFEESDLIIAQEFTPTEFDWRIGILEGRPLYACRYMMAKGHWQIVKHGKDGVEDQGDATTLPVHEVPDNVVRLAVRAAALMGQGLYGVDLKQYERKAIVIEVNDNPSLDAGVEDAILGDQLYETIMRYFLTKFLERGS